LPSPASAAKELDALPQAAQQSVIEGLNSYAMSGKGDVKKLSGREGYRLRIGAYRIIFSEDAFTILAIHRLPIYIDVQEKLIMIPIRPQTIRSASGEELIVLTRAEFDALIAAVADQLEDADDVAVFDERMAALQNGQDARLPAEVTAAMLSGDSLIRALRRWKGLTQTDLAGRTNSPRGTSVILKTTASQGRTRRCMPSLRRLVSTRPGSYRGDERLP
jgi:mRNA-degrading endonuclease RelE of RelBE toxin-antitoxin system